MIFPPRPHLCMSDYLPSFMFSSSYGCSCDLASSREFSPEHGLERPLQVVLHRADELVLIQRHYGRHTEEKEHHSLQETQSEYNLRVEHNY